MEWQGDFLFIFSFKNLAEIQLHGYHADHQDDLSHIGSRKQGLMEYQARRDPGKYRLQGVDDAYAAGIRVLLGDGLGDEGEACGKQHEKQQVAPDFTACG